MNVHYLKLDATNPEYETTIAMLRRSFATESGGNELSVNLNRDKTAAWLKVQADHGVSGPILLADEPESNVDAVRAEVSQESWTGPIPRGPRGRPGVPT